jgi:NADPH:quinone reductase-like Zn-dependent oxidoreductase
LGAEEVVIYTQEDVKVRVMDLTGGRGVDVVVDHVGAEFWPAASASLAPGGRYCICGVTTGFRAELQMGQLFLKSQTILGVFMGRNEDLRQVVEMAGRGVIRGVVHQTYPLQDAARAHEAMEGRGVFGKLVLTVP